MRYFVYEFKIKISVVHDYNRFNLFLERELNKTRSSIVINSQITLNHICQELKIG